MHQPLEDRSARRSRKPYEGPFTPAKFLSTTLNCGRDGIVNDIVRQADLQGLPGMQLLGCEEHLQRAGFADETRQALCSSPAGDQSERCSSMSEDGMRPRDAAMTGQCQVKSSAHAVAMHSSDRRAWKVRNRVHQALTHLGKAKGLWSSERNDLAEVCAGRKEMWIAGNDQSRRRTSRELFNCLRQRLHPGARESVRSVL